MRRMGYAGAQMARYLGGMTSAMNHLADLEKFREGLKYT